MPRQFNPLERELIDWFIAHGTVPNLAGQLAGVRILRREYTVVGFHVWLVPASEAGEIPASERKNTLTGPGIISPDLENGGSTKLWIDENGFVDCLELWANEGSFPEEIKQFELQHLVAH